MTKMALIVSCVLPYLFPFFFTAAFDVHSLFHRTKGKILHVSYLVFTQ